MNIILQGYHKSLLKKSHDSNNIGKLFWKDVL